MFAGHSFFRESQHNRRQNYQYDARLKGYIPPAFPRESVFSVVYWKDKVKEVPATTTTEKDDSDGTTTTTGQ